MDNALIPVTVTRPAPQRVSSAEGVEQDAETFDNAKQHRDSATAKLGAHSTSSNLPETSPSERRQCSDSAADDAAAGSVMLCCGRPLGWDHVGLLRPPCA